MSYAISDAKTSAAQYTDLVMASHLRLDHLYTYKRLGTLYRWDLSKGTWKRQQLDALVERISQ